MAPVVDAVRKLAWFMVRAARARLPLLCALALGLGLVSTTRSDELPARGEALDRPGVRNLGRLTPLLYRGGDFMPDGVQSIVQLGVKTVVSLRWTDRKGERDSCAVHGIAYRLFRMSPQVAPDPAVVDSVLDLLRDAKAPVFFHCSAGDHRTGTICALYRIRVQGWSQKQAWAEQEAFGFGPRERHAALFQFVYGDGSGLN